MKIKTTQSKKNHSNKNSNTIKLNKESKENVQKKYFSNISNKSYHTLSTSSIPLGNIGLKYLFYPLDKESEIKHLENEIEKLKSRVIKIV